MENQRSNQSNSWLYPRLRYNRVRNVRPLTRANEGDAGLDFYVPRDLTLSEINAKNPKSDLTIGLNPVNSRITKITLAPHSRILIPSGIRVLIEPRNSMLQANNKSGVSTKKGLIFTAQVVDSPYTGEIHIGVVNTSDSPVDILADEKLIQFIHVPIFLTEPEEIQEILYESEAEIWGTRGDKGFGSSDNSYKDEYEDELAIRQFN